MCPHISGGGPTAEDEEYSTDDLEIQRIHSTNRVDGSFPDDGNQVIQHDVQDADWEIADGMARGEVAELVGLDVEYEVGMNAVPSASYACVFLWNFGVGLQGLTEPTGFNPAEDDSDVTLADVSDVDANILYWNIARMWNNNGVDGDHGHSRYNYKPMGPGQYGPIYTRRENNLSEWLSINLKGPSNQTELSTVYKMYWKIWEAQDVRDRVPFDLL